MRISNKQRKKINREKRFAKLEKDTNWKPRFNDLNEIYEKTSEFDNPNFHHPSFGVTAKGFVREFREKFKLFLEGDDEYKGENYHDLELVCTCVATTKDGPDCEGYKEI